MPEKTNEHKKDFPALNVIRQSGKPASYLDSAATAQMPASVSRAVEKYWLEGRANAHRGLYAWAEEATEKYENAREVVRKFLNARSEKEIIFTKSATEGINLVASGLQENILKEGDRILVSVAEHHANFVPWQILARKKGIVLDVADTDPEGRVSLAEIESKIYPRTKLAAFFHVSNVTGVISSAREMGDLFRRKGIMFLLDAAQSAAHMELNARDLNCDFLVFSGHKLGAPEGIGILYGREEILRDLPPLNFGGGMISEVSLEKTRLADLPRKMEAGTPNVAGAAGLEAALDYISSLGWEKIKDNDEKLTRLTLEKLAGIPKVKIYGPKNTAGRSSVVSFAVEGIHPHDLASILNESGVFIRAGHHCAMPLLKKFGVSALARASFWVYNNEEDVERLAEGIEKAKKIMRVA